MASKKTTKKSKSQTKNSSKSTAKSTSSNSSMTSKQNGGKSYSYFILIIVMGFFFVLFLLNRNSKQQLDYVLDDPLEEPVSGLIQECPDEKIVNKMPGPGATPGGEAYFIYDGLRVEVEDVDLEWVEDNCNVQETVVF